MKNSLDHSVPDYFHHRIHHIVPGATTMGNLMNNAQINCSCSIAQFVVAAAIARGDTYAHQ